MSIRTPVVPDETREIYRSAFERLLTPAEQVGVKLGLRKISSVQILLLCTAEHFKRELPTLEETGKFLGMHVDRLNEVLDSEAVLEVNAAAFLNEVGNILDEKSVAYSV